MEQKRFFLFARLGGIAALAVAVSVSAGDDDDDGPTPVNVGAKIFADPQLSASGTLACASCHDPAHAHAQSNDLPVQLGGANRELPLFTEFSYDNLGVPRNALIPATADADYFDLGLCGPDRADGSGARRSRSIQQHAD